MGIDLVISETVKRALAKGAPVVALESTIITHGMPAPDNITTALQVEGDIRDAGAVPATIAVLKGKLHIGLDEGELAALAETRDVKKLSRADLASALALGWTGSTTVAATMIAAERAGIDVFATGGIGGVHRGVTETYDVSADLQEFVTSKVVVVAAGVKAILDITKTLEVLETLGVPVIAFDADDFPAFWSRSSGLTAPMRLNSEDDIARVHLTRGDLGLQGGMLVANPIPAEAEIPRAELEPLIEQSLADAFTRGISGKAVTPFLLSRMFELTKGRSLVANIALIRNNARLAARISAALAKGRAKP